MFGVSRERYLELELAAQEHGYKFAADVIEDPRPDECFVCDIDRDLTEMGRGRLRAIALSSAAVALDVDRVRAARSSSNAAFSPPVSFDRCWIGRPSEAGQPPRVTRIRRVAEIWVNQGLEVSEWVPAPIVEGRRG